MTERLLVSLDHGVARLVLNRPAVRNAFDEHLISELTEAYLRLGADPDVRAIVLSGNGPGFCAGGDIGWMRRAAAFSAAENFADAERLARLMATVDRCPKPTIARIHGAAYGGGLGLIAASDVAVATEDAEFRLSEVRIGLLPAAIGPFVSRAIGPREFRRYALTGEAIDAATARRIGLVHEVHPGAAIDAAIERLLGEILSGAPGAIAETKDFACALAPVDEPALADAARRIAERRASAEGREGVSAFLDKRRPSWRAGRS